MKYLKRTFIGIACAGMIFPLFGQTTGTLSFSATTSAPSGNWGDQHVAAIWIQNNEQPSVFIKTNAKYGGEDDHLTSWIAVSGKNLVDATTGATLTSYGTLSINWDGTDIARNVVMDGDYTISIEMGWGKDKVNAHATSSYTFTKGATAQQLTPTGNSNYSNISLSWEPTATLIYSVEDEKGICVFPNPSSGAMQLQIQNELQNATIEVYDITGKNVYSEKLQVLPIGIKSLDISDMPRGLYMLSIHSNDGYFNYKLLLE